jgi:regulator of protease activity HflC (stomatin/prohibitin superfamily)
MTNYGFGKDRVIEAGGLPVFRLVAIVVVGFFIVICLFAAVAKVPAGHVGVLTLFGRVTGEVLPEGMHLVNPFKSNNVMSIRTEQIKESASVPSSEGLVMALDTSLLFHLNPGKAADLYQRIGPNYVETLVEPSLRAAIRTGTLQLSSQRECCRVHSKHARSLV